MLLSTTATTSIGNKFVLFLACCDAVLLSTTSSTSSVVLLDLLVIGSQLLVLSYLVHSFRSPRFEFERLELRDLLGNGLLEWLCVSGMEWMASRG